MDIVEKINRLKKERRAIILAHYYTRKEVQAVADFLGDSLALSIKARETDADVILFAGVNFMAETAKVLCPEKRVLIPRPEAGCSLADSCPAEEFARFVAAHPDHRVVSYVNTSVGVKAVTDICCTSSNALKVIESIPRTTPIIFGPDHNLGSYIQRLTGRDNMLLWDGACLVHERFTVENIERLKAKYPDAKVVVHPECKKEVVDMADYAGSTAGILKYCGESSATTFLVVTEAGILAEMERLYPAKQFIPVPPASGDAPCNECHDMKLISLEDIATCLENLSPEVVIDEEVRKRASKSIENMVRVGV